MFPIHWAVSPESPTWLGARRDAAGGIWHFLEPWNARATNRDVTSQIPQLQVALAFHSSRKHQIPPAASLQAPSHIGPSGLTAPLMGNIAALHAFKHHTFVSNILYDTNKLTKTLHSVWRLCFLLSSFQVASCLPTELPQSELAYGLWWSFWTFNLDIILDHYSESLVLDIVILSTPGTYWLLLCTNNLQLCSTLHTNCLPVG